MAGCGHVPGKPNETCIRCGLASGKKPDKTGNTDNKKKK